MLQGINTKESMTIQAVVEEVKVSISLQDQGNADLEYCCFFKSFTVISRAAHQLRVSFLQPWIPPKGCLHPPLWPQHPISQKSPLEVVHRSPALPKNPAFKHPSIYHPVLSPQHEVVG